MFIPINAKSDVQGSKKGKLTPAQNAQLNAFVLSYKTGILDVLDKCEAEQLSYDATNNIATIVFRRGYVVICGRLVECEAGTQVQINTPATGSVTGNIILRYNLSASKEEEFVVTTTTEDLITQDLNLNTLTGIYEFPLYEYTATPNKVELRRNAIYVKDMNSVITQLSYENKIVRIDEVDDLLVNNQWTYLAQQCFFFTMEGDVYVKGLHLPRYAKGYWANSGSDIVVSFSTPNSSYNYFFNQSTNGWIECPTSIATYASADTSKGTIEERLTALGFKEGSIVLSSGNATVNKITRYGNNCIINAIVSVNLNLVEFSLGFVPVEFYPNSQKQCYCKIEGYVANASGGGPFVTYGVVTINTNGSMYVNREHIAGSTAFVTQKVSIENFGYDAKPL